MRVIIAGGGTGGHIFPAISIAEEIIRRSNENEILFVGTKYGLEKNIIPKRGYKLEFISSKGIVGKGFFNKIMSIASALTGMAKSHIILRNFKPDIVVGVGGYVSGPTVISAYINLIPTAICEQNFIPGITNRILSKFAKKIFLSFCESSKYFPKNKVVVTGNPIRSKMVRNCDKALKENKKDFFTIFVMGGSQGASKLNKIIPQSFKHLSDKKLGIIHQTGEKDRSVVEDEYKKLNLNSEVHAFIDDIFSVYSKADLIISRAGASTISEIGAVGKPSILIPYPHAAHNHQYFNAKMMEEAGASFLIKDEDLTPINISKIMDNILDINKLQQMSQAALKLGRPKAAEHIVEHLYSLVRDKQCMEK